MRLAAHHNLSASCYVASCRANLYFPQGYLIFPRYNLIMAAIPIVILLIYADTEEKSNQFLDEEVLIKELLRPILLYVHL